MGQGIFVTGGSGFVGTRLLPALATTGRPVYALDRSGRLASSTALDSGITVVRGDLLAPESYQSALSHCDVVLHLAATTGKATAEEHLRVNARGTEMLVQECRRQGVRRLAFVSSIAATFTDVDGYPYAQAKKLAEEAVRHSGLDVAILRPTIILGADAPVLRSLEKLALLPVAVLPGNGRARVQPVHVDDLVRLLVLMAGADTLMNDAWNVGGRDVVTMEGLLRRIREARRGSQGPLVRVPLWMFQLPLRLAEAAGLGAALPISAGQLTSFSADGVANGTRRPYGFEPRLSLDDMLIPSTPIASAGTLAQESETFTRHLVGMAVTPYVTRKYEEAHTRLTVLAPVEPFDAWLVRLAARGHRWTKLADAYAALFAPASALRQKLVLLLAILETSPPFCKRIDKPVGGGLLSAAVIVIGAGLLAVFNLVLGALVVLPARAVFALRPGRGR